MRMPALAVVVTALALFLVAPAAADVSGNYAVDGRDPNNGTAYRGGAAVVKKGATYHVVWSIGDHRFIGTGILTDGIFAVTYVLPGTQVPGIALYTVGANGHLTGYFTMLGAVTIGEESWTPVDRL